LYPVIIFDSSHDENQHVYLLSTNLISRYEILVGSHGDFSCINICWCKLFNALALGINLGKIFTVISDRFKFVAQGSCST